MTHDYYNISNKKNNMVDELRPQNETKVTC